MRRRARATTAILLMSEIFLYQIYYRKAEELDPGFRILDNTSNERPDWFEYWPIRKFLLNEALDEDSFYGFLSPKFKQKTNLGAAAAIDFVRREGATADIVLLSPSLQWTAYHWNVFEFGDAVHPGLLAVADRFFRHIGQPTDLHALVSHSQNEVYSNYIIAKPRFWREWLGITEKLFALAEAPEDPIGMELRKPTSYRGSNGAQMKVFIVERIATWMLARQPALVAQVRDPFVARSRIYKLPGAIICDALKIAYVSSRREEYKDLFYLVSTCGRFLSWQIRLGNLLGFKHIRMCVQRLTSYWTKAAGS
jgi:hypothetical protein